MQETQNYLITSALPNQQLKLTVSAKYVKHCANMFLLIKIFFINLFRYQQLAGYRCRSLVAIRYAARAASM